MQEILPGIFTWHVFNEERQLNFNGWFVVQPGGNIAVDPPMASDADLAQMAAAGGVGTIVITNKDHRRFAHGLRERFGAPILVPDADAPLFDIKPDGTFHDRQMVAGIFKAIVLPDAKSPGETALYWAERGIVIVGDGLIGDPPGKVRLLPDAKYKDVYRARTGVEQLRPLKFEVLLPGDGTPILANARDAVMAFLLD